MKHQHSFKHFVIVLAALLAPGFAADEAPPTKPVPVAPEVRSPVQGVLQLQFGGQIIRRGAAEVNLDVKPVAKAQPGQLPVILFPGVPFLLLPNPAALGDVKPGYLGVNLDPAVEEVPQDDAEAKDKPAAKKNAGVGILAVVEDSPAAKAGLAEGDRVLTFDGKEAKNSTQLREIIRATRPEQAVKLTVRRDGKEIEIKAKLAAAPDAQAAIQFAEREAPNAVPGIVVFNRNIIVSRPPATSSGTGTKTVSSDKDIVLLRDGNRFSGKIQGIDPAKGLVLKREGLPDVELLEEEIGSLTLADREKTATAPAKVHLQLRDGSWFHADGLTMEQGKILLTLPGGQQLEIPREHVRSATVSDGQAPQIYEGPMGLDGWAPMRSNQAVWDYKDGFLRCHNNGPIGRNFERLPDPLDLSFDVVFPRELQHFGITLFSAGISQSSPGSLTVQFSPNQIYGHQFDGRRSNQYNTEHTGAANAADAKASRYRLLVDRINGRALVYIDGVKRADWKISKVQPADIAKCGGYLSISPNISIAEHIFQFGRMRVLPWDGKEPANGAEPPQPNTDQVLMADGSATKGAIEKISDQEILFANPPGSTKRDRTLHVRFAAPPAAQEFPAAAALLRLKNGSAFAATQLRGDGEAMDVTTRFGSRLPLAFSALREIEFFPKPGQLEPSASGMDILTLTDSTQFKGRLVTPVAGENLLWKIAASRKPLEFPTTRVAGVRFGSAKGQAEAPGMKGSGVVRLRTGDWLQGDVLSVDASRLLLRTDLSPELDIPLTSLHSLYLGPTTIGSLADGATGRESWAEGWNPNRSSLSKLQTAAAAKVDSPWIYHDASYALTGANRTGGAILARKWSPYIGAYAVNVELANSGRTASFSIQLFNSKQERTFTIYSFGGRVNVYFNPSLAAKGNRVGAAGKRFQVEERAETIGANFRLTAVMDRPARTFRLFASGKEIGKIPFKEDEAQDALDVAGMSLSPMSSSLAGGKQSRIAGIWTSPWSGSPPSASNTAEKEAVPAPGEEPKKTPAPEPTIYLANGDEFAGTIGKVSPDAISVNSDAGELELPIERVAWVRFPGPEVTPSDHFPRLRFHDRGLISVKELHFENDRVKCQTVEGRALEFPLNLVKEVVYRPLEDR